MSDARSAEGEGRSVAEARWAAIKSLEAGDEAVDAEAVEFETLDMSGEGAEKVVRVRATIGGSEAAPEREPESEASEERSDDEEFAEPKAQRPDRRVVEPKDDDSDEWPEAPAERLRQMLEELVDQLDVEDAEVVIEESDDELVGLVEGDDVGLLIGKHGQTIDAVQLICSQAAYRGLSDRKRVVVDAAGYRERRAETLCRQADRAASDALRDERPIEMESMTAQERRVVHNHLKDNAEVETYSEGDEPYRFVVVAPV